MICREIVKMWKSIIILVTTALYLGGISYPSYRVTGICIYDANNRLFEYGVIREPLIS